MRYVSSLATRLPIFSLGIVSAIAFAAAVPGCSGDSTAPGSGTSGISFTTGTSSSSSASMAVVPITNGGHTLDLTGVRVTVARVELKRAPSDACPGDKDDAEDDDHPVHAASTQSCGELKIGPTIVDLPLTGGMVTIPANTIPAGTFRQIQIRVVQVELKGTFDTKPFDAVVLLHTKTTVDFSTPLVVTDNQPISVTLNLPVSTWLVNSDGSLVDPNTLATSSTVQARVASRIASSLRAFEDRDHDGKDDHDGKN